nr:hypothetical protein [Tanacetum cinerariifolium]
MDREGKKTIGKENKPKNNKPNPMVPSHTILSDENDIRLSTEKVNSRDLIEECEGNDSNEIQKGVFGTTNKSDTNEIQNGVFGTTDNSYTNGGMLENEDSSCDKDNGINVSPTLINVDHNKRNRGNSNNVNIDNNTVNDKNGDNSKDMNRNTRSYASVVQKNEYKLDTSLCFRPTKVNEDGSEFVVFDEELVSKRRMKWKLTVLMLMAIVFSSLKIRNEWKSLGKPNRMDNVAAQMCQSGIGRAEFARVLVEFDVNKGFKEETEDRLKKKEIQNEEVEDVMDGGNNSAKMCSANISGMESFVLH